MLQLVTQGPLGAAAGGEPSPGLRGDPEGRSRTLGPSLALTPIARADSSLMVLLKTETPDSHVDSQD